MVAVIAGSIGSLLLPQSPPAWFSGLLASLLLPLILNRSWRLPVIVMLAMCWSLIQIDLRLQDRLGHLETGQPYWLTGVIASVPVVQENRTHFRFSPHATQTLFKPPSSILVSWYRDAPELLAGETWQLKMTLKPPWGAVNFSGPDRERWLFANGIGATATVREGEKLEAPSSGFRLQQVRLRIRQEISARVAGVKRQGIVRALAIADTSGLDSQQRKVLQVTGTSHLLAISGLHIGLAAAGGFWLFRILSGLAPAQTAGKLAFFLSMAGAGFVAGAYAALANLGVSVARALVMLLVFSTGALSARRVSPARSLTMAAAIVLLIDPFAPLGAGFWFSFLAVMALLITFVPRTGRKGWLKTALLAQIAVLMALLPVSAAWFSGFSLLGFPANMVAIPWVSLFVVPPVLGGLAFLPVFPEVASLLWGIAGNASDWLFLYLDSLASLVRGLTNLTQASLFHLVLAFIGAMLLLLPRVLNGKWLGIFLILPLFLPAGGKPAPGSAMVEVLDAGQGTAALVSTSERLLVYDTGPGDGSDINVVDSTIIPAIRRSGHDSPDLIVVSHGDLDHAGGLAELRRLFPGSDLRVNAPDDPAYPCIDGWKWRWGGADFHALHPSPGLPYMKNDSSCVIGMRSEAGSLLLTGDISRQIEDRISATGDIQYDVLLVPHHGSKSSSSMNFIEKVNPDLAIATASLGNRFGFPRQEVREQYRHAGVPLLSTGECGAVRLLLRNGVIQELSSARKERKRIWRWPAHRNCP